MADNDAELEIGIKLDETQFTGSFQHFLSSLKDNTAKALQDAFDSVQGSAAKNWSTLPFSTMHKESSGAQSAAQAFVPGFAQDLRDLGVRKGSQQYEAALMSAIYKSSVPDPTQRQNLLLSYGQNAPTPGSDIERVLSTDYSLMSMPWSRAFFSTHKRQGLKADDLQSLHIAQLRDKAEALHIGLKSRMKKQEIIDTLVSETNKPSVDVDFAGMREYAVEHGIGRWTDKEHTAKNFELIDKELDKIEDKSDNTKKSFTNWNDTLKGVLGTLTAIGTVTLAAGQLTAKAEGAVISAGNSLDKRRAFIGMSALDEMRTRVASKAVGLGENAIRDEIYGMSESIEQYKLLGQGDALPAALLGIFDNLMTSENPYDTYLGAADELYAQFKNMGVSERKRYLMLMNKAGLGSMSSLVGQFLSNPDYAKTYGTPSKMFELTNNPYYGAASQAELLTPQIAKLNESLKASYDQMALDWEKTFGIKFKTWWDDVMRDKVVPWFQKFLNYVDPEGGEGTLVDDVSDVAFNLKVDELNKKVGQANSPYNIVQADAYTKAAGWAIGGRSTLVPIPLGLKAEGKVFKGQGQEVREGINSEDYNEFYEALGAATKKSAWENFGEEERDFSLKAKIALGWLNKTGYKSDFLADAKDLTSTQIAKIKATMDVVKAFMASEPALGDYDILDNYASSSYLTSPGFALVADFINMYKDVIKGDEQKQHYVKIQLLDPFGKDLPAKIAGSIVGDDFTFTTNDDTVNKY